LDNSPGIGGGGTQVVPVLPPTTRNFDNKKYCGVNINDAINSI